MDLDRARAAVAELLESLDVVNHYDAFQHLGLTPRQKRDLVEYLKSL